VLAASKTKQEAICTCCTFTPQKRVYDDIKRASEAYKRREKREKHVHKRQKQCCQLASALVNLISGLIRVMLCLQEKESLFKQICSALRIFVNYTTRAQGH
jgi:hypothetical protein